MLSGFKGVKYGLTVPKKEAKPGVKKPLAVFADGDSDEDEQSKVAKEIERQAQRKQSNAKVMFAGSPFDYLNGGLQQSNLSTYQWAAADLEDALFVKSKSCNPYVLVCNQVAELQAAALAEDPSIFDYDSHFDSMQLQREGPAAVQKQARKSQYIESLLDKAKERQKEQDIVYERK